MAAVEQHTRPMHRPEPRDSAEAETSRAHATSILVVEDEGIVARDLQESLTRLGYRVTGVASEAAEALRLADRDRPELVVMDVSLRGEIDGIETARLLQERADLPIIFLTGHSDPATLERAVLAGPLGYILKPFQEAELRCAIEVAIHKHRAQLALQKSEEAMRRNAEQLENLSLSDELTGLKNRRGFFELSSQAMKVARREHHTLALFFMDLNGLKQINDNHGHPVGDQALRDVAAVLRSTFRDSDIVARLGGDEFIALAHVTGDVAALRRRLHDQLAAFNARNERTFTLDLSIGAELVDVAQDEEEDLDDLIARADAAMYAEKRARRAARTQ